MLLKCVAADICQHLYWGYYKSDPADVAYKLKSFKHDYTLSLTFVYSISIPHIKNPGIDLDLTSMSLSHHSDI